MIQMLLVVAALTAGAKPPPTNMLQNTSWEADGGIRLEFYTGDSMRTFVDGRVLATATYRITASTFSIIDRSGPMTCAPGKKGLYSWLYKDHKLELTKMSEKCEERGQFLHGLKLKRSS